MSKHEAGARRSPLLHQPSCSVTAAPKTTSVRFVARKRPNVNCFSVLLSLRCRFTWDSFFWEAFAEILYTRYYTGSFGGMRAYHRDVGRCVAVDVALISTIAVKIAGMRYLHLDVRLHHTAERHRINLSKGR